MAQRNHDPKRSVESEENENLMAALSYLIFFVSGITFLFLEKKNSFVRFHAMQSTITFGSLFILITVLSFIPFGWVLNTILWAVGVLVWIVLMIKAFSGEHYKLPYVGEIAEKQLKRS